MENKRPQFTQPEKCAYFNCCYLADALECHGYKADCVLYKKSNNRYYTRKSFDEAVDQLIDRARAKYDLLQP
jgi:hypothetical protein